MPTTVILLLAAVVANSGASAFTGQVFDEQGAPLAGAVVDVYAAKPRMGPASICPSCYRDCAKSAKTNSQGQFSISDLDPTLLFRVLVLAPGRRAVLTEWTDPVKSPLEVKLEPLPTGLPSSQMFQGRVLDERGKPLAGAVVSPTGAKTSERIWMGQLPGVDEAAVTDLEGRFVITSRDPKLGLYLQISASGYAEFPSQLFDLDGSECEISMRRGATVSGRLTHEGQPAKRRLVGMAQRDRSPERFVGATTEVTDDQGGFTFAALQPDEDYVLYSLCDTSQDLPALKMVSLKTGRDGDVTRIGELSLRPGLALAGKVELPIGAKMPDGATLRVIRDPPWDWCEVELSNEGEFMIRGLSPEVYSVHVVAPGFEIDASRMRYQVTGASEFGLRLRPDGEKVVRITAPMKSK